VKIVRYKAGPDVTVVSVTLPVSPRFGVTDVTEHLDVEHAYRAAAGLLGLSPIDLPGYIPAHHREHARHCGRREVHVPHDWSFGAAYCSGLLR
jgi:hypothetical protein